MRPAPAERHARDGACFFMRVDLFIQSEGSVKTAQIEIRPYRAEDNDILSDIWLRASRLVHGFLPDQYLVAQQALVASIYLPEGDTYVAVQSGRPVGFIGLRGAYVGGLFVDPASQRKGTGRRLLARAFEARAFLTLGVYALNDQAQRFYKSIGFEEVGRSGTDDQGMPFEVITLRCEREAARL